MKDKHFRNSGDLKLKCTATIATIYWKSNEESVQGVRAQSALVSESRSSRNSGKQFLKYHISRHSLTDFYIPEPVNENHIQDKICIRKPR